MLYFVTHIEYLEFYDKKFKERFDVIFTELDIKNQAIMLWPFIFFMRRLLVVALCNLDIMALRIGFISYVVQTAYLIYWI
jgi:hypothetical protein